MNAIYIRNFIICASMAGLLSCATAKGQVALNTDGSAPDPSAILDIRSTTRGVLLPRLTNAERDAIATPASGLVIYNTDDDKVQIFNGTSWAFLSHNCGTPFYDKVNGDTYQTIMIGSQCWFLKNLKATKLNDGTDISEITDDGDWGSSLVPAYCWYDNNSTNADIYGALYNGYAVSTGNLYPSGWHVSTYDDWMTLRDFMIDIVGSGLLAKSLAAGFGWRNSSLGTPGSADYPAYRNKSGFRALPGGYRDPYFFHKERESRWWYMVNGSGSEVGFASIIYNLESLDIGGYPYPEHGFSVRCVRD